MNENEKMEMEELKEENKTAKEIIGYIICASVVVLGYQLGKNVGASAVNRGFKAMFEADPTFKEHFVDAYGKAMLKKLK